MDLLLLLHLSKTLWHPFVEMILGVSGILVDRVEWNGLASCAWIVMTTCQCLGETPWYSREEQ